MYVWLWHTVRAEAVISVLFVCLFQAGMASRCLQYCCSDLVLWVESCLTLCIPLQDKAIGTQACIILVLGWGYGTVWIGPGFRAVWILHVLCARHLRIQTSSMCIYVEDLSDTEFSIAYMNYHNRLYRQSYIPKLLTRSMYFYCTSKFNSNFNRETFLMHMHNSGHS